jgi:chemotaxis protein MotB
MISRQLQKKVEGQMKDIKNRHRSKKSFIVKGLFLLIASGFLIIEGCSSGKVSKTEVRPVTSTTGYSQQLQVQTNIYQQLNKQLQSETRAGWVQVRQLDTSLKIIMVSDMLFPGGGWTMDRKGREMLDKIIPVLKSLKETDIEVCGFTDNSPVGSALRGKFSTNRELSLARAVDVVNYLKQKGISPGQLTATGYGQDQPVSTNDTPQGRAMNRRMEILILAAGS